MTGLHNSAPSENGVIPPNYPRNLWWFAAKSDEVTDQPLGLWLLDEPVVLYRKGDSAVAALDNRCPHRWAPLSLGEVIGDTIKCPYHGFQFAADGSCAKIPSQSQIPRNCRVKAYPIIERHGLIWIWTGDAEKASETDLPLDTDWLVDPTWSCAGGTFMIDANYQLLKENVLDLTHIPHIHAKTIGAPDFGVPPSVQVSETTVSIRQEFPPTRLPPVFAVPTGIGPDRPASRSMVATSYSPAAHRADIELTDTAPPPGAKSTFRFSVMHLTTPESPTRFRYQWFMGWDVKLSDEQIEVMSINAPKAYTEDKVILEAIHQLVMRDPRHLNYPEIFVQADQAAIQNRRKLAALLEKEAAADGDRVPPVRKLA